MAWKNSGRILVGLALAAHSQSFPGWLSGSLRGAYFQEDKSFDDGSDFGATSLWLTVDPEAKWGMRLFADARAQVQFPFLGKDYQWEPSSLDWEIREGYLKVDLGQLDLRAGRQITVWGRADKVNPTDVWSARDYTLLATDDEDQRLGIASARILWNVGNWRLTALWQPEWRASIFPLSAPPPGFAFRELDPEDPQLQAGVKCDYSSEALDGSLSYAHAIDQVPNLRVLQSNNQDRLIGLHHGNIDVFGADAASTFGGFGFRGEIAYTRTDDEDGSDPLTRNSDFFGVVGSDRTFASLINVNLQYLYRYTFDFRSPDSFGPNAKFALQQNLSNNQLESNMHGMSSRISLKTWNETLETELTTVIWFNKGDNLFRPKATYAFSDHVKFVLGAEIYSGPTESFFGRLKATSSGFVETRVLF